MGCGPRHGEGFDGTRERSPASSWSRSSFLVAVFAPVIAIESPRSGDLSRLEGSCCPGPIGRASVRNRPAGTGRVLPCRLRSALLADHRDRGRDGRAHVRPLDRRHRRLHGRLGRLRPDAAHGHHARHPGAPARNRPRGCSWTGPHPDHGRRRGHAGPDLRAPVTRIGAGAARNRLRPRRPLRRRARSSGPPFAHSAELRLAHDRAGHAGPGDGDHRRRRPSPVLDDPNYIVGSGADTRVVIGCLLDAVNALAGDRHRRRVLPRGDGA